MAGEGRRSSSTGRGRSRGIPHGPSPRGPGRSIVAGVAVRIGCGLSVEPDARAAAVQAAGLAVRGLDGRPVDVALAFPSGSHLAAPKETLEGVHDVLSPTALAGCGAGGVLGDGREIEDGTAVAVWAAALDGGGAEAFHADVLQVSEGVAISGLPDLDGATAAVLLPDPLSFPTEGLLRRLHDQASGVPVLGGLSSAHADDGAVLLCDGEVHHSGAVGLRFSDVEVLPCVSQGATPLGPELTVTAGDGHVIRELAGRPALEKLREVVDGLEGAQRTLVGHGLLMGVVIGEAKPEYGPEDFLVSGLAGADPGSGAVAVGAIIESGTVVRLHVRDAGSAHRELRAALALRREALGGARPAGALLCTCNGRGTAMFGAPGHDARLLGEQLGAPAAGFFAAGEIGPVGGRSFLHGFTATVAVFPRG